MTAHNDSEKEIDFEDEANAIQDRMVLLANMAARIAAGTESNPGCDHMDCEEIAERAIEIAEAILVQVGL